MAFQPSAPTRDALLESLKHTVDFYSTVLLEGMVPTDEWQVLQTYAARIAEDNVRSVNVEAKQRSLVYLLLASPDYELS